MPDPALTAETDQFMAALRDELAVPSDVSLVPRAIASLLRRQFPDMPGLGRVLVSAVQAMQGLADTGAEEGAELGADQLLIALALAGAVLDQEEGESRG